MSDFVALSCLGFHPRFNLPRRYFFAILLACTFLASGQFAHAERRAVISNLENALLREQPFDGGGPFGHPCTFYSSAREFVQTSALFCASRGRNRRSCERRAVQYFGACRYQGDFQKLLRETSASMLLMLVLVQAGNKHSP